MTEDIKKDNQEPVLKETKSESAVKNAANTDTTVEKPKKRSRKAKRSIPIGQMHVQSTFNNTIVSFTDTKGNLLSSSSAGACGFRGSKKGTAYAAQIAVDKAGEIVKNNFDMRKIAVFVKGVGLGRDAAIRAVLNHGIMIDSITDVTGIPHGGVRPKKARRV